LEFFTGVLAFDFFFALVSLPVVVFDFNLLLFVFGVFMTCSIFLMLLPFLGVLDGDTVTLPLYLKVLKWVGLVFMKSCLSFSQPSYFFWVVLLLAKVIKQHYHLI
jgi:hypothetical protein